VKGAKQSIGRAVDQPDARIRFYLFHGDDEGQSRGLAARLLEGLGATKALVAAGAIKNGTTSLVDEAGAISLFGGARLIWVEPANDDIAGAVASLLESPAATESAVVAIAGKLRKTSELLKLAEGSPNALAFASYPPEGKDAAQMVIDVGRRFGLKISSPVAARVADHCANDQAIVTQELDKLATYIDASPHAPKELGHDAIDEVGAESNDGAFGQVADLALLGDLGALGDAIERLSSGGSAAIPIIRSLQRRLLMLAPARARVERGERPDAVMTSLGKSLFWKDKEIVAKMLRKWSAEDLAKVSDRAAALERELMFTDAPEREALGEALLTIGRKARNA
jgi:DNA polymerase-3 subunit delta